MSLNENQTGETKLPRSRLDIGLGLIEAAGLLFSAAEPLLRKCQWSEDTDGAWATTCDEVFEFTAEGPKANGFKFCPFCGGELLVVKYTTPNE